MSNELSTSRIRRPGALLAIALSVAAGVMAGRVFNRQELTALKQDRAIAFDSLTPGSRLCGQRPMYCDGAPLSSVVSGGGTYALLSVSSAEPATSKEAEYRATLSGSVVWQTETEGVEWAELPSHFESVEISSGDPVWENIDAALGSGRVILGVTSGPTEGSYVLAFALVIDDRNTPSFLYPLSDYYSAQLRQFASFLFARKVAPCNASPRCGLRLLIEWNREKRKAEGESRPIGDAFDTFSGEMTPAEAWAATPTDQRSLSDAPESITTPMSSAELWVYVPDSWRTFTDGAICFSVSEGSNGCIHVTSAGTGHLVPVDALVSKGSTITVEVRPLEGDPSAPIPKWTGRIPIGTVDYSTLGTTNMALVNLDPARPPASYAALATGAGQTLATASPLDEAGLAALLEQEPVTEPDPLPPPPCGPLGCPSS